MPGIDPGTVDIDVDGQLMTIRAQRTLRHQDGVKWLAEERPHGTYLRQFSLGEGVDVEKITANYDNGVLSVLIPVSERAKPRKIEVSASAAVRTPRSHSSVRGTFMCAGRAQSTVTCTTSTPASRIACSAAGSAE